MRAAVVIAVTGLVLPTGVGVASAATSSDVEAVEEFFLPIVEDATTTSADQVLTTDPFDIAPPVSAPGTGVDVWTPLSDADGGRTGKPKVLLRVPTIVRNLNNPGYSSPDFTIPAGATGITVKSKVCNDPDTHHGNYFYQLVRHNSNGTISYSNAESWPCYVASTGEEVHADYFVAGAGEFVKPGYSYYIRMGFASLCAAAVCEGNFAFSFLVTAP
ncbi:MAG: hypothetical protein QOE45_1369 [Frankiaceae bacterium]|nr:hypothetical protein [Frankiaceae bacterium]